MKDFQAHFADVSSDAQGRIAIAAPVADGPVGSNDSIDLHMSIDGELAWSVNYPTLSGAWHGPFITPPKVVASSAVFLSAPSSIDKLAAFAPGDGTVLWQETTRASEITATPCGDVLALVFDSQAQYLYGLDLQGTAVLTELDSRPLPEPAENLTRSTVFDLTVGPDGTVFIARLVGDNEDEWQFVSLAAY